MRISQWSCSPCSPWNLNKPFLLLVGYSAIFQKYTCNIEAYCCYNEDCKLNCKSEFRIQFVWRVRSLLHSCSVFLAIYFFSSNLWGIKVECKVEYSYFQILSSEWACCESGVSVITAFARENQERCCTMLFKTTLFLGSVFLTSLPCIKRHINVSVCPHWTEVPVPH